MEVHTPNGRFITWPSTQTQTDWEWVEQRRSFSCQVQKETEDPRFSQAEMVVVTESSEVVCLWAKSKDSQVKFGGTEENIPYVGLPRLIAYKPEPKETEKGWGRGLEFKQDVHLAQCDYCHQLCQPFIHSELLDNGTKGLYCCEQAKQMREVILEEGDKLAQKESNRKINVNPHVPIMSEEEREAAKEKARERLKHALLLRNPEKRIVKREPKDVEVRTPPIEIKHTHSMILLQGRRAFEPKLKDVTKKFYKNGISFLTSCSDTTGNVFYPSGKVAIMISSAEADGFIYIILEDKDVEPSIKGIFTNKGHATCYHPNGMIWVNLTPVGGVYFSEDGSLKRRWSWREAVKPLTFALVPHISVRIHSQERVHVTFAHRQNSIRFNVGSKLKLIGPGSLDKKPKQNDVKKYIRTKSSEIYSLLGQMQTWMSRHSTALHIVKPH